MSKENELNENQNKKANKKEEIQVTLSSDCEAKLQQILQKINSDFEISRVTRKHLLDHMINEFCNTFTDDMIHLIQKSAVTDFDLLEIEYREAKRTGVISDQLREYLWKTSNLAQGGKSGKKSRQPKHSNAIVEDKDKL